MLVTETYFPDRSMLRTCSNVVFQVASGIGAGVNSIIPQKYLSSSVKLEAPASSLIEYRYVADRGRIALHLFPNSEHFDNS